MVNVPQGSVVIVAHPDDEALWFSSVLRLASQVVLCFGDVPSRPECSAGRRAALSVYPLPNVTALGLTEAEVFEAADWRRPRTSPDGMHVGWHPRVMPGYSRLRYRQNYASLVQQLRPLLRGVPAVFSHGPWGEYGHEEHVQVFRAVDRLREELGFRQFFPAYASAKSMRLAERYLPALPAISHRLPTDQPMAEALRQLYIDNHCWTWFSRYTWPSHETYLEWFGQETRARPPGTLVPLELVGVQPAGEVPFWSSLLSPAGWRVRLRECLERRMPNESGEPLQ